MSFLEFRLIDMDWLICMWSLYLISVMHIKFVYVFSYWFYYLKFKCLHRIFFVLSIIVFQVIRNDVIILLDIRKRTII